MDRGMTLEASRNVARRAAFSGSRAHKLPRRPSSNPRTVQAPARTRRTALSARVKGSSWLVRRVPGRGGRS
jgi:hypothetical protein